MSLKMSLLRALLLPLILSLLIVTLFVALQQLDILYNLIALYSYIFLLLALSGTRICKKARSSPQVNTQEIWHQSTFIILVMLFLFFTLFSSSSEHFPMVITGLLSHFLGSTYENASNTIYIVLSYAVLVPHLSINIALTIICLRWNSQHTRYAPAINQLSQRPQPHIGQEVEDQNQ
ncbi:hypothetical protein Krac_0468 [Ktedonobacter racemifer DSM 44963]|uniref:Uncharacterized protein n=1 Tax=Ktedonobacter racemifer DSM 44963 TaxID=485913 RepID=D6U7S8_KTERA|nr:hypothetical protein Krac_0468 [Ktedonobacter racemifer DSM 44963]